MVMCEMTSEAQKLHSSLTVVVNNIDKSHSSIWDMENVLNYFNKQVNLLKIFYIHSRYIIMLFFEYLSVNLLLFHYRIFIRNVLLFQNGIFIKWSKLFIIFTCTSE